MKWLMFPVMIVLFMVLGCDPAPTSVRSDRVESGPSGTVVLFDGSDISAWTCRLDCPAAKLEEVWQIKHGVLVCTGKTVGYLGTREDFENYRLTMDWRWAPGTQGGNSGLLVHSAMAGAPAGPWPKSFEVQLKTGDAGDVYTNAAALTVSDKPERLRGRRAENLLDGAENPIGQWNRLEVTCRGDTIEVQVNGRAVNKAENLSIQRGFLALQSEGAEIHFRNIRLERLK